MSYQVLARKWRPRAFADMVGQEHVLRPLINALDQGRLHHAYLFTGSRGVGKTTLARILAKCLNCESGVSSRPCGDCAACREIDEGRFVDLIEVDAASRTKVEDTRDLLENVPYTPARGRYKVYLIDEVHMLSAHSFNALLKTLEEPPPHVKFLLATTDPQRLPVTVLSRCLQFNLKLLGRDRIAAQLGKILAAEQIASEPLALSHLARAAQGSMRDALSLLDQAIAYGAGEVSEADVRGMLGTIERVHVLRLLQALADADAHALLVTVAEIAEQGADFDEVLVELLASLQSLALLQQVPDALDDEEHAALGPLAARVSAEDVQLFYEIALMGRRDLAYAPEPRDALEMALLRMLTFRPVRAVTQLTSPQPREQVPERAEPPVLAPQGPANAVPQASPGTEDWAQTVAALKLGGVVRQLAANCVLRSRDADRVTLRLEPAHGHLLNKARQDRLCEALQEYYGSPVKLSVEIGETAGESPAQLESHRRAERQKAAVQAIEKDPNVTALRETFNADVRSETIQPLDD